MAYAMPCHLYLKVVQIFKIKRDFVAEFVCLCLLFFNRYLNQTYHKMCL